MIEAKKIAKANKKAKAKEEKEALDQMINDEVKTQVEKAKAKLEKKFNKQSPSKKN